MSNRMTFPDTVEEFMEQYKIVDEQKIYTNGTELVPIFRMEQWFEHRPDIILCENCRFSSSYVYCGELNWTCNSEEGLNRDVMENSYCSAAIERWEK